MEVHPKLLCESGPPTNITYIPCTRTAACDYNLDFRIDYDHPHTIRNILTHMPELICNEHKVGAIGSTLFIGFMVGSLCLMRITDLVGRKKSTVVS